MSTTDTYPIVLACGIARYDRVPPWRWLAMGSSTTRESMHYFKRIRAALHEAGAKGLVTARNGNHSLPIQSLSFRPVSIVH